MAHWYGPKRPPQPAAAYLDGTLYTDISPMKQAQAFIRRIVDLGHEPFVVTANLLGVNHTALRGYFYEGHNLRAGQFMLQFLWEYYPEIPPENIMITSNKKMVKGDVLIDDNPNCLREGAYRRVLIDKPYNRDIDDDYFQIYRAKSWDDVERFVFGGSQ